MKTEALIDSLASNLAPVRRLSPPSRRLLRWLAVAGPAVVAAAVLDGLRPDLAASLADFRFVIELAAALATGLAAAWAAFASTIPGAAGWRLALPLVPATVWLASVGAGCWREWLAWGASGVADKLSAPVCLPEVVAAGAIPVAVLLVMVRRGASLHAGRTAALAALAAGALASAALSLSHGEDAAVTALVWHFGSVALLSGLAARFGRRLVTPARFP